MPVCAYVSFLCMYGPPHGWGMCVCDPRICVCFYNILMYVVIHAQRAGCMHVCMYAYMHVYIYIYVCICTCLFMYVYMHACMNT
jgi:hypothetical protein